MNHADTAAKLVALAADEAAPMEERRTAAFTAAQIMAKHVVAPVHTVHRSFDTEFERRHYLAQIKGEYLHRAQQVYEVLADVFDHPATPAKGRAELNRLCYALAQLAGDVVLQMPNIDETVAEIRQTIGVVAQAFGDWEARQEAPEPVAVRNAVMALFDSGVRDTHLNSLAAKVHAPVPAVQIALDELVAAGLLRTKSKGKYTKVKRRPKAKAEPVDPRQTDMFGDAQ